MDTDNSGHLSLSEFQQVIDNFKIPGISASDAQRLFNVFDKSGDGLILF
jgi:Ca2+-binding EF-hand superfamily protein